MTLHKAHKKASKDVSGLSVLWRKSMHECDAITVDGAPASYSPKDDRWKVFRDLSPKMTWSDVVADDWEIRTIYL